MFALEHDLEDIKSKIIAMPDNTNGDGDNQTVCEFVNVNFIRFVNLFSIV